MSTFSIPLFFIAVSTVTAASQDYKDVLIAGVPHVRQKPDFCGEACVEMVLRKLGKDADQDGVFDAAGVDPTEGRGCRTAELKTALEAIGFKVGKVFSEVKASEAPAALEGHWAALHADLLAGIPSIICTHYDDRPDTTEHFRLILGYDRSRDEVIYHEPAAAEGAYLRMKRDRFLALWPLKYKPETWTVIRLPLEPGKALLSPRPPPEGSLIGPPARHATGADFAQHIHGLKGKLPQGFGLVLERPFVVVGDGPLADLRSHAIHTVRWAVSMLKQEFFREDPGEILDIWLFKDETSYRLHTRKIFGDKPSTPFGYYSQEHRALIMNIATGGGTLVHEIVHPFMRANFPSCPAWFNEGLASLYEQSAEREGHIRGLTNWRLDGLQKAIRAGDTVPFEKLTSGTDSEFYSESRGVHYAQARYLCYYLQERGLLVKFYQDFAFHEKADPTGLSSLKKVLGQDDLKSFQERWNDFVLNLKFH
jgi:hypothetical protein